MIVGGLESLMYGMHVNPLISFYEWRDRANISTKPNTGLSGPQQ